MVETSPNYRSVKEAPQKHLFLAFQSPRGGANAVRSRTRRQQFVKKIRGCLVQQISATAMRGSRSLHISQYSIAIHNGKEGVLRRYRGELMVEETERLHDALDGRISTILINRTNNSFKGGGRHFWRHDRLAVSRNDAFIETNLVCPARQRIVAHLRPLRLRKHLA